MDIAKVREKVVMAEVGGRAVEVLRITPDIVDSNIATPLTYLTGIAPYELNGVKGIIGFARHFLLRDEILVNNAYIFFEGSNLYRYASLGVFRDRLILGLLDLSYSGGEWHAVPYNRQFFPVLFQNRLNELYNNPETPI
ncbi:MAG: hypothetical protein ACP5QH_07200 [Thermoplasmata archaeon]|jgi:hypothetical protein